MYISVILPISVKELYHYNVPESFEAQIVVGGRVVVELGVRKVYSAIIHNIYEGESKQSNLKNIIAVLDTEPITTREQIKLWEWISTYYLASLGDVMRRFFPASMRVDTYSEVVNSGFSFTNKFLSRNERFISLSKNINSQTILNQKIDGLSRAKVLSVAFLKLCDLMCITAKDDDSIESSEISVKKAVEYGVSSDKIRELTKKNLLETYDKDVKIDYDVKSIDNIISGLPQLSPAQLTAESSIKTEFTNKNTALLFGIAGSGKTEIYSHLIASYLGRGENILLLLPDLSLSAQLIKRLECYFGSLMLVYNGRQNPKERHSIYNRILFGEKGRLIVTTHSGIGLPFSDLGLIIVDEEHSESYKSSFVSPRLNARDTATVLAQIHGAKCLLVSATPAIKSFHNCKTNKYGLIELKERYNKAEKPLIKIIERRLIASKEKKKNGFSSETRYFSNYLLKRIAETIEKGEQVILYQNRRGYNSTAECKECGAVPVCPECNISLSYHKSKGALVCHYCSYSRNVQSNCLECGSTDYTFWGIGTENIEEKIKEYFPEAGVVRVDSDTASSAKNFNQIIASIENGEYNIIVGTNLITKGFDFKKVSLIGVINCDSILNYADFRASERAYSLLNQLLGRTARCESRGEMIIQTNNTQKSVVEDIAIGSYETMYERELLERSKFGYPPFSRIIEVTISHAEQGIVEAASNLFADELKTLFGNRVLGATIPQIEKINGKYLRVINIKIEIGAHLSKAKAALEESVAKFKKDSGFKSLIFSFNVDC
ncbi:MAG: primosomal protein N' [Rikenellaceae bacterium]